MWLKLTKYTGHPTWVRIQQGFAMEVDHFQHSEWKNTRIFCGTGSYVDVRESPAEIVEMEAAAHDAGAIAAGVDFLNAWRGAHK